MAVEPARLKAHMRFFSDPSFPRNYVHTENLDCAAAYIRNQLEQAQGELSYQSYEMKGKTYRNVIALFGPDTEERIFGESESVICFYLRIKIPNPNRLGRAPPQWVSPCFLPGRC